MIHSETTRRYTLRSAFVSSISAALFAASAVAGSVPVTTEFSALTGNSATRGELGSAVAVLGHRVFLGAPAADVEINPVIEGGGGPITVNDAGVVGWWERNANGAFSQVGNPIATGSTVQNSRFGTDMASSADFLAITQAEPPAMRIYQIGLNETLLATLSPVQMGPQGDSTRVSSAIFGSYAAAGVVRNFNDSGSVEIYMLSGGQWSSSFTIDSPSPNVPDIGFGYALSMTADSLFVGIPYFVPVNGEVISGAVLEYGRPNMGNSWNLRGIYTLPGGLPIEQPARMGFSVHSANNLLVIGAPELATSVGGDKIGGVFVYQLNSGNNTWELRASIPNPDAEADAEFGYAVATDGSKILVGAPGSNNQNGRGYLYVRSGPNQWTLAQEMIRTASGPHRFGAELALTGTSTAIIAAPQFAQFGGAAYEYRFIPLLMDGFE